MTVPLLALLLVIGCEEDPTSIGKGILPGSDFDNIVSTDTFGLDLYSEFTGNTKSINPKLTFLGALQDPFFGRTSAGFITQLWLYESWPETGLLRIDSVKLYFDISQLIGTMTGYHIVNIYETDEFLSEDSVYYVSRDIPVKQLLGSFDMPQIDRNDTTILVNLPINVGEEIFRDTTQLFLSNDSADFRNYFNGLYFEYVQSEYDHMLGIDLVGGGCALYIYYHDTDTVARSYRLLFNDKCVRYNRFIHDFETADADKKIKYINQPVLDTLAYVQSFDGVYTKLVIPGLEGLRNSMPLAINKARLNIPVYIDADSYTEDMIPEQILARYVDSSGTKRYLKDYDLSASFLDGSYDFINNRYKLNIPTFVQQYLDGEISEPMIEIFIPGYSGKNLIMKANGASESPYLEIAFTELF